MRNRVLSNRVLCLSLPAVLLVMSGCATPRPEVRVDKADADLSKCRTFDWRPVTSDAASFTDQRVRAAALKRLEEKGYTLATDKPDCQITYVLATQDKAKPKPSVGVGVGGGSGGARGGIGVSLPIGKSKQHSGTFTLDVIDAAKNAQVWSGSIDAGFSSAELNDEDTKAVVDKVLAEYPDRVAKQ